MNIAKSTRVYEDWLTAYTPLVASDIAYKHEQMAAGAFPFLRATFYRWSETWPLVCDHLMKAPIVLAVGDLHMENFGTWRDAEGRLVWGVNDFDEASHMPYANDLVRLATSAQLAIEGSHLRIEPSAAFDAILRGYKDGLTAGGKPFVLAENHMWLRPIAESSLRDPVKFWKKMEELADAPGPVPASAAAALERSLPLPGLAYKAKTRVAGLGNLGKPRFVALAEWDGGMIAREAKALTPSAAARATMAAATEKGAPEIYYQAIVDRSVRCQDPFVRLEGHWIVRRLAPDCSRIELSALADPADESRLLHAMGWETANIHCGTGDAAPAILRDIKERPKGWLAQAAHAMTRSTHEDWQAWKSRPSADR